MKRYLIFSDKTIKKTITINSDEEFYQVESNMEEGDQYKEVDINFDLFQWEIDNGKLVKREQPFLQTVFPITFNKNMTDTEIENKIQYHYGLTKGKAKKWKKENYNLIRSFFYPSLTDYTDAIIKINSGDEELKVEGEQQLKKYYSDCLAVKKRFPK